jgi:RHS repeat-associated protein
MNRLTSYVQQDTRTILNTTASFSYGTPTHAYAGTNNRVSVTSAAGQTTYQYDAADRMTAVTPPGLPQATYGHDADGNLASGPGGLVIGHDLEDQMNSFVPGDNQNATVFTYDGDGRRVRRQGGGTTRDFIEDVALRIPQLLEDGLQRYVYGPGGIAYATSLDGSALSYAYHLDGQGSVRALTTGASTPTSVLFNTSYDPFGVQVEAYTEGSGTNQPFGYTGAYRDPTTGTAAEVQLTYLRARWYNPLSGRFIERDSEFGDKQTPNSLHRYSYGMNNPLAFQDPTGHFPEAQDDGAWWLLASCAASSLLSRIPPGWMNIAFGDSRHGLSHMLYRHAYNGWTSNASTWTVSDTQIGYLIRNAEYATQPWTRTNYGNWARLIQVEMNIGESFGRTVDYYTVVARRFTTQARPNLPVAPDGWVYEFDTAFPGLIRELSQIGSEYVPVFNRFPFIP